MFGSLGLTATSPPSNPPTPYQFCGWSFAPKFAERLGSDIASQLVNEPKALFITSGILLLFAVVPGFPTIVFLGLSTLCAGAATVDVVLCDLSRDPRSEDYIERANNVTPLRRRRRFGF